VRDYSVDGCWCVTLVCGWLLVRDYSVISVDGCWCVTIMCD